jgi:heme A synthase
MYCECNWTVFLFIFIFLASSLGIGLGIYYHEPLILALGIAYFLVAALVLLSALMAIILSKSDYKDEEKESLLSVNK